MANDVRWQACIIADVLIDRHDCKLCLCASVYIHSMPVLSTAVALCTMYEV
jgi:hypothetical protein